MRTLTQTARPTRKEKRAAAGKTTVCGALSIELTETVAFKRRGAETKLVAGASAAEPQRAM